MERVSVWGINGRKPEIVGRLYELGVFHIEVPDSVTARAPLLERLREQRGEVLELIEFLRWDGWRNVSGELVENVRRSFADDVVLIMDEAEKSLERIRSRLDDTRKNRETAEGGLADLREAGLVLSYARAFLEQERFSHGEVFIWKLPRQEQHRLISRINGDLDFLPSGHEKPWFRHHAFTLPDRSSYLVTSASPEVGPNLRALAGDALWRPPRGFENMPLLEAASRVKQALRTLPLGVRREKRELESLSSQWGVNLAVIYTLLDERLERLLLEASAQENEIFFTLEGWIPEREVERVRAALKRDFGSDALARSRAPDPSDGPVPTALRNHAIFKPFELFLKLLRVPRYGACDPSPLIGIFFPFFAGCMVGDIGYGLLVLLLGLYLKKKKTGILRDAGVILLFLAFWSVAWGGMFGEFFGDMGHRLFHMRPIWLDRAHAVLPVMAFSVALGGAHVLLGIFIGMLQGLKNRNRHLWMERLGTLLTLAALVAALVLLRMELPSGFFSVPATLLVFGLIFLVGGGGVGGIVETLGVAGHIVSYVRIAAIGLSSAILAMVAGAFVDIFGVSVLGLFMAFAIHLLNFVLAVGGSSLHAARLHYVEFMGKFYQDGTLEYKPFGRKRIAGSRSN
jgi:V/A-type H+-transporting ATPase subunit I